MLVHLRKNEALPDLAAGSGPPAVHGRPVSGEVSGVLLVRPALRTILARSAWNLAVSSFLKATSAPDTSARWTWPATAPQALRGSEIAILSTPDKRCTTFAGGPVRQLRSVQGGCTGAVHRASSTIA